MPKSSLFTLPATLVLLHAALAAPVFADQPLCGKKIAEVERQHAEARAHGHDHKARGLQRALDALRDDCTDQGLIDDARGAVDAAQQEVAERQADLDAAIRKGDKDDIKKRREKLKEARQEWAEEQADLEALLQVR
ncbi:Protein YqjC [Alloalcanivorax dieselolei B5]|uniref:Protein YqjC n=1 Tax=Alcanivorax dieselolei (strain DSM 16502 / CGMCC 1.3690 / MCCC 1A00001 / B-5) TaxID=930169 RepID=K0CDN2_ALCDB|nr:DUF1090 domain-containing protein [Alloalcanivorax dieselolei]AFT71714.1 Protein YqjC [Alloalcanivorax dieselolei B5]GGJ88597.1 hypothetical protein GCM10007426_17350 [Alloalcanivorax dieselolei]